MSTAIDRSPTSSGTAARSTLRAGYATTDTPNGPFTVVADDEGRVLASGWSDDPDYLTGLVHRDLRPESVRRSAELSGAVDAVQSYYAGDLGAPSAVPVVWRSGPFLEHAWATLRGVPAGHPISYSEFADRSGNAKAIRGAASACARNAAALFVPCHRVLRNDGTLGGFRYGLEVKRWLLDFEQQGAAASDNGAEGRG